MTQLRVLRWAFLAVALLHAAAHATAFVPVGRERYPAASPKSANHGIQVRSTIGKNGAGSTTASVSALHMWGNDDEIVGQDRIKACIPYLLPLIDGDHFGRYIYMRFPPLRAIDDLTVAPLAHIVESIPFLSLGLFLLLSLGTRNSNMARGVRFSAQQAVLLDVALIFPELIGGAFEGQRAFLPLMEPCSNFVYYAYMTAIIYSVISNLQGKKPDQIPIISNAANMAVGPF